MQRLRADQRLGVLGVVLVAHFAAILALLTARMVVPDAADDERALTLFVVTPPPPPPSLAPPPADTPAHSSPRGTPLDQRAPAPAPVKPLLAPTPPPPASTAIESIIDLPAPLAASAAPISGSGVSGADGEGLGSGGAGGAGTGAGTTKRFRAARWIRRPAQEYWDRVWPRAVNAASGKSQRLSGQALLACAVRSNGVPHRCSILDEQPQGRGIGRAARTLLRNARVRPVLEDGLPIDLPVIIQIEFDLADEEEKAVDPARSSP